MTINQFKTEVPNITMQDIYFDVLDKMDNLGRNIFNMYWLTDYIPGNPDIKSIVRCQVFHAKLKYYLDINVKEGLNVYVKDSTVINSKFERYYKE